MCGRFSLLMPVDAMAQMFAALPANNLPVTPNYNICPTNNVSTVVSGEGRRLVSMRWGFVPQWYKTPTDGPLLINARAETLAEKPAFRDACRSRRCLIPATGFYEWSKGEGGAHLPWYIYREDGTPVVFAGIWQRWDKGDAPLDTCAIVTTGANGDMSGVHHRMPVILPQDQWGLWLGEEGKGAATLMQPAPDGVLRKHRVGVAVNSNKAQGPELIEPE
jgi:putative SOS response-associated peptidase YedK